MKSIAIGLFAGLALIALAIWHKPLPGRYHPDEISDRGIVLLDTQTGQIHVFDYTLRVWTNPPPPTAATDK